MTGRPLALLAFSHDPQHALKEIVRELSDINKVFVTGNSAPIHHWSVSQQDIEKTFETYRADIRIFHFAGHAGPSRLQTSFLGKPRYTFADGLARNVGLFGKGLKLVFLNGCSTRDQVDFFLNNGVPAVIATSKPVSDVYACWFARIFYEKFTNGSTLGEAFEAAKNSFDGEHGNFCDRVKRKICQAFLHKTRAANADYEPEPGESLDIYDLYTQEAVPVRQEKFADWFPPVKDEPTVPKTEPRKINGGKHESGYLLCDRDPQARAFHQVLLEKINGRLDAPQFFFAFDTEPHCPQLLYERFEKYALRELFRKGLSPLDPEKMAHAFHELPLPQPELFGKEGGYSDLYKTALSQLYYDKFGGTPPGDNSLAVLQPQQSNALVVMHRLAYGDWRGPENLPKLEALLRFYLGPYAADLQAQLSKRLIVFFQLSLLKNEPLLQDEQTGLFARLKMELPNVHLLTRLPGIDFDHLQAWERDFLGVTDNTFLDPAALLTVGEEAEPRDELPFKTLLARLKAEIQRFNQTFAHAA